MSKQNTIVQEVQATNMQRLKIDNNGLYHYTCAFHDIVDGRGRTGELSLSGMALSERIDQGWMSDIPVVELVNELSGPMDVGPVTGYDYKAERDGVTC